MKQYIDSILPKLKRYSASLDNMALFVDQPWVLVDEAETRRVYVFRSKENELLVSVNGNVRTCRWEYLEYMNSLLIDVGESKTLYNQGFLDEAVMILKKDGRDDYMMLVNENKISEYNPERILGMLNQKYLEAPQHRPDVQEALDSHDFGTGVQCVHCRVSRPYVINHNYFCPKESGNEEGAVMYSDSDYEKLLNEAGKGAKKLALLVLSITVVVVLVLIIISLLMASEQ